MKRSLLCYLFFSLLHVSIVQAQPLRLNYLNPETYRIDSISVEGGQGINPQVLISISGLKVGDQIEIPGSAISDAIQNIWKQGIISHIDIRAVSLSSKGLWLIFMIEERGRLTGFEFSGTSKTQRDELKEKLQLSRGRIYTEVLEKQTENIIKGYFKEKGYLYAQVKLIDQADTLLRNGVKLHIEINKGKKIKIRQIRFLDQRTFSQARLKAQFPGLRDQLRFTLPKQILIEVIHLLARPLPHLRSLNQPLSREEFRRKTSDYFHQHVYLNFFKSRKFDQKKYKEGKEKLVNYMHSQGYRNAYIVQDTIRSLHSRALDISLRLHVGNKHYIRNITWVGNVVHDSTLLSQILGIKKGDIYDPALLEKRINFNPTGPDVSSLYLDNGYLFFNIRTAETRVEKDSVDLELRIYEGKKARIERVIITGNERTREHVLRRELRTLPGDYFSRAKIIRTQQLLSQLPYINAEETIPVPVPNPETQQVDIEWRITEKAGDQVELSAGWGAQAGFIGSLGFVLNNFSLKDLPHPRRWRPLPMGEGQRLGIRFRSNGPSFLNTSITFTEPWLGGSQRNNLSLSYSYSKERYFNSLREVTGSFGIHGININLIRSLKWPDDYFTLGHYLSYDGYRLQNASNRSLGFSDGTANALSLSLVLGRSSIDNPNYPRQGSYVSLSGEFTPPYSAFRSESLLEANNDRKYKWIEYNKWILDLKTYTELLPKLVLESRIHFGAIARYTSQTVPTPFERFSLGGDGLGGQNFILGTDVIGLRGYPNNSIAPTDVANNIEGGRYFSKAVMELRYLVLQLPAGSVYVLSFLEGGNSWNEARDLSFYNLYRSAGLGVRLQIPALGLVGLDWGRAFDRLARRNERTQEFHFTIGRSIR